MAWSPAVVDGAMPILRRMFERGEEMTHSYESPVDFHRHNTPCKVCGKTARHSNHKLAKVADCGYCGKPVFDGAYVGYEENALCTQCETELDRELS